MAGKILVVRGGAIGDFILTLPVLAALRENFPKARVEVLGYPHIAALATAGGLADAAQPIEARALAGFFARNGELDPTLSSYFKGFGLVLSYLFDPDEIFQTNVKRASKAQFIQGPHRPSNDSYRHATEVLLKPLERLAIFGADPIPRLTLRPEMHPESISIDAGNWCAVHPGSGSESKNWPESKWAELLPSLIEATNLNLLLVGGEAEGERLQRLASVLPANRIRVAQSLPLATLALLIRRMSYYVGHDSGISHLAGALGVSGDLLWGESSIAVWGPRGNGMRIIEAEEGLEHLSAASVFEVILARYKPGGPGGANSESP